MSRGSSSSSVNSSAPHQISPTSTVLSRVAKPSGLCVEKMQCPSLQTMAASTSAVPPRRRQVSFAVCSSSSDCHGHGFHSSLPETALPLQESCAEVDENDNDDDVSLQFEELEKEHDESVHRFTDAFATFHQSRKGGLSLHRPLEIAFASSIDSSSSSCEQSATNMQTDETVTANSTNNGLNFSSSLIELDEDDTEVLVDESETAQGSSSHDDDDVIMEDLSSNRSGFR